MRLCVDACIGAKWFVPEDGRQQALGLYDPQDPGEISLVVPDLFFIEVANAFRHHLVQGNLALSEMREAVDDLCGLEALVIGARDLIKPAVDLADRYALTMWDAAYLAVADRESCEFWTADSHFEGAEVALQHVHILTWA